MDYWVIYSGPGIYEVKRAWLIQSAQSPKDARDRVWDQLEGRCLIYDVVPVSSEDAKNAFLIHTDFRLDPLTDLPVLKQKE